MASAALCNLLKEIQLAKTTCVDKCLGSLIVMTESAEPKLVHHAAWCLKNLTYSLPSFHCSRVIQEFHWFQVKKLLCNTDASVQESVLRFLQNLCSSSPENTQAVIEWSGGELLSEMSKKLQNVEDMDPSVVAAALRVVSNVATGSSEHQWAIIDHKIPEQLPACLRDERSMWIRIAAVFCIINLTWRDELPCPDETEDGAMRRAIHLRNIGIEAVLEGMTKDESLDVRERVKNALGFFEF